jgi:hypothetical protein
MEFQMQQFFFQWMQFLKIVLLLSPDARGKQGMD